MLSATFMLSISNDYYFSYFSFGEREINNRGKKPKQTKPEKEHSEKFHLHLLENRGISVRTFPFTYHPEAKNSKHLCAGQIRHLSSETA